MRAEGETRAEALPVLSQEALAALRGYRRLMLGRFASLALLALLALAAFLLDLGSGPAGLSVRAVIEALLTPDVRDTQIALIVWEVRLPQSLLAILVGAALAIAGVEMQASLGNPLASPFTLGAASAATFGASLSIVTGFGAAWLARDWLMPGAAFLCAFATTILIWAVAGKGGQGAIRIVLLGIGVSYAFQAFTAILQYVASPSALQQIIFWTMGSLSQATFDQVRVLGLALALTLPLSLVFAWRLTLLRLGDDRARSLGVDTRRLRLWSLLRASILTATAMSFVGTIGFVGLVGPHIARLLLGEDTRFLLPGAALTGAAMVSLASVVGKFAVPGASLPIGIVTAVIGLPVFFALVLGRRAPK